ncbi:D-alanyl-D-alanine carboxypeptidase dacB precursor [Kluyvera cryocrescens]|uniref:D-alanyl-D-alanine carboxypeptidase dacB n=1 Tax=Kluyvera cryocrescens TaxID=580 RepID=A0A485AJM1_KLUCR|nr:D-alanyl-D-alanine carboxypeptidase dacB precursor [Kluyvera cryocrescens]
MIMSWISSPCYRLPDTMGLYSIVRAFIKAGVDGKVSAKTGSLQAVYNLAGFITTASGQRMAFVQYLSGYAGFAGRSA